MRLLKAILDFLFGKADAEQDYKGAPQIKVAFVADLPDEFANGALYIAGENGCYWCAGMRCPCGCGAAIHLSLVKDDDPTWRFSLDQRKRPSLSPSVWRTTGCRSHFFLRRGAIIWCREFVADRGG